MRRRCRTSTRTCSARAPTPARASTTSTPSRRRWRAGCRKTRCSATISSRASSPARASPRTSNWSRSFPPATTSTPAASIAGRAATGSCCPGSSGAARRAARSGAGRCSTTCAARCWRRSTLAALGVGLLAPLPAAATATAPRPRRDRAARVPARGLRRSAAPHRRAARQSPARAGGRPAARRDADLPVGRLPRRSGLADGRRHRANPGRGCSGRGGTCWSGPRRRRRPAGRGSGLIGFVACMAGGVALGLLVAAGAVALAPASWPLALPFALLWGGAPALAFWVSRRPQPTGEARPVGRGCGGAPADRAADLALSSRPSSPSPTTCCRPTTSRRTRSRSSRTGPRRPTSASICCPPSPRATSAGPARWRRSSGWRRRSTAMQRLPAAPRAFLQLVRDARPARARPALRLVRRQRQSRRPPDRARQRLRGVASTLRPIRGPGCATRCDLAREAVAASFAPESELRRILGEIGVALDGDEDADALLARLSPLADAAVAALEREAADGPPTRPLFWIDALRRGVAEHRRDRALGEDARALLAARYGAVAAIARRLALAMDFAFLLDPDRKLLSIGYSVADNRLDPSCYDLLASEARLASLFAIAKGDVPTRHWFRLGRAATPLGAGSALISWSGSMFEYLMPIAGDARAGGQPARRRPTGWWSRASRPTAGRSACPGASRNPPTTPAISNSPTSTPTSACRASGLKRGLADERRDRALCDRARGHGRPAAARCATSPRLPSMGARGRYGFYEALDFTPRARARGRALSRSCATSWRITRA